jgi:hypothetical protein
MTPEQNVALEEARRALGALASHSIDDSDAANDAEILLDAFASALVAFLETLPRYRAARIPSTKLPEWLEKASVVDSELRETLEELTDIASSAGYDHQLDNDEVYRADALREQVANAFDAVLDRLCREASS